MDPIFSKTIILELRFAYLLHLDLYSKFIRVARSSLGIELLIFRFYVGVRTGWDIAFDLFNFSTFTVSIREGELVPVERSYEQGQTSSSDNEQHTSQAQAGVHTF